MTNNEPNGPLPERQSDGMYHGYYDGQQFKTASLDEYLRFHNKTRADLNA